MAPWTPGDEWPSGLEGGASSPHWGGYIRLWIRAGLAPGRGFHVGQHDHDRLDAGNVLTGASTSARVGPIGESERLWIDLSCDTMDVQIAGGASSGQGVFSKADAATCVVKLSDPDGDYDPLNSDSPWAYGGRSRLVPGTPVEVFAEVVDGNTGTWTRHYLFTGTADSWGEDWTPQPSKRVATLVATDVTKQWTRFNRAEQSPVGAGDTTAARVERLASYFDWTGEIVAVGSSTVTLQATTLAATGWEMLNRAIDDELGYVHFTPDGKLRWLNRDHWFHTGEPVLTLGCAHLDAAGYDVLVDAAPSTLDLQMRNAVYAARTGGTTVTAVSPSSLAKYGEYSYKRTDLGVETDSQAGEWAEAVVTLYAYPTVALENVTMVPAIASPSWECWNAVLALDLVTDLVRLLWAPPDAPERVIDTASRVVGFSHTITRNSWEVSWELSGTGDLGFAGAVFTMGPHSNDRLDAGMVLAFG